MFGLLLAATAVFSVPDSEVVDLPTAANGIDYQLYVHVPPACREPETDCPVIYTLDAEYAFPLTATIVTHLADRNRIDPLVTVSIGYPDKSQYRANRTRDYTPFPVDAGSNDPNARGSGGGAAFRTVIREEIIPFVEANYPVSADRRTIVGHSYGGLFAANTLLTEPELFDHYLIVSPSLWYGDGEIFSRADVAASANRASPLLVYLAVGSFEEQPENGRAMVSDAGRFAATLEAQGEDVVQFRSDTLQGETHASVFPAALSNGLRAFFGP